MPLADILEEIGPIPSEEAEVAPETPEMTGLGSILEEIGPVPVEPVAPEVPEQSNLRLILEELGPAPAEPEVPPAIAERREALEPFALTRPEVEAVPEAVPAVVPEPVAPRPVPAPPVAKIPATKEPFILRHPILAFAGSATFGNIRRVHQALLGTVEAIQQKVAPSLVQKEKGGVLVAIGRAMSGEGGPTYRDIMKNAGVKFVEDLSNEDLAKPWYALPQLSKLGLDYAAAVGEFGTDPLVIFAASHGRIRAGRTVKALEEAKKAIHGAFIETGHNPTASGIVTEQIVNGSVIRSNPHIIEAKIAEGVIKPLGKIEKGLIDPLRAVKGKIPSPQEIKNFGRNVAQIIREESKLRPALPGGGILGPVTAVAEVIPQQVGAVAQVVPSGVPGVVAGVPEVVPRVEKIPPVAPKEAEVAKVTLEKPATTTSSGQQGVSKVQADSTVENRFDTSFEENDALLAQNIKSQKDKTTAWLKRQIVDQTADVKDALNRAGAKDATMSLTLKAGSSSEAERQFKNAKQEVYGKLPRADQKLLAKYVDAIRTQEATRVQATRGKQLKSRQGITDADATAWLENFERTVPDSTKEGVKVAAESYWAVMRNQLDQLREVGLIGPEAHASLVENHKHYSPRQFVNFIDPETGVVAGRRIHDSGIKALDEGSESAMVTDPHFLLGQVISRTQNRTFQNRANVELARFIEGKPEDSPGRILRGKQQPARDEGVVIAYRDGQPINIALPQQMADQWNGQSPALSQDVANIINWISGTKPLKFFATGINPEFAFSNLPRDMAFAWFNSGQYSRFLPPAVAQQLTDYAAVSKDSIFKTGAYIDYVKEGGGMDYLTTQGKILTKPWERRGLASGAVGKINDILAWLGETSEIATRLATRNRAIKNGLSPTEATFVARNMLDFSQGGRFAKSADKAIPYLNAAIQGTRGTFRAFKTDPAGSSFKAAQLAAIGFGIAYAARSILEEAWDSISDREKATKWIIPLPLFRTDKNGRKRWMYLAIPKDQFQQVFAAIGQSLSDAIGGKPWGRQMMDATGSLIPVDAANLGVPVVNAGISYFGNYDTWTQQKIWRGYEDISPKNEYTLTTPEVAKNVSEMALRMGVQISPERLSKATSKLVPMSNPIASSLVNLGELTADKTANDTIVEKLRKWPGARRFIRFSSPTDVPARMEKELKAFDIKTAGKTKKDLIVELKKLKRERADVRHERNLSLDRFVASREITERDLRTWLKRNIEERSERIRLWNRARARRPELITRSFSGRRPSRRRTRR